jgi:alpha-amylase
VRSVVLYFQVHQPWRLRPYGFFDVGRSRRWFDDATNRRILRRVADRCYRPANRALLDLVRRHDGRFRCAFSVSGTALDQMERWAPSALSSFRALARTGAVEVLAETSHHSLSCRADLAEFRRQALAHAERVEALFGAKPTTFRNTELVVDPGVAREVEDMGFTALLAEGADGWLRGRTPHATYRVRGGGRLALLLRSYRLSDDVAFRFGDRGWPEWPLTPEKFAGWLSRAAVEDEAAGGPIGLFMDYETFGEHHAGEGGILRFLSALPDAVLARPGLRFLTPAQAVVAHPPRRALAVSRPVSWADAERDLTAWLGNDMQREAHRALYDVLPAVRRAARAGRQDLLEAWRRLSTSDHVYYMCTKWFSDGDVHKYFSPYASPHDAYLAFVNVLDDLEDRARAAGRPRRRVAAPRTMALSSGGSIARAVP